jgi:EAL domain-containing protein (putative c-di-GMP-specific phosphodiesterase class I)/CheY-like chemotaxis protein
MILPRVLVMDNHGFQRSVLVKMLQRLGVRDVLQASNGEQAMVQMHLSGGVDIVLCDLGSNGLDCLEFLHCASKTDMVRAVVLFRELQPELQRAIGQMALLSGIELLGMLSQPLKLRSLHKLLQRYSRPRRTSWSCTIDMPAAMHELPSEDDVRRGLALGEFRGWFQPKLLMDSGELAGAEVLVRWEHPARGLLLPKDFLAAVLAYDLIDEMFKQLLEQGLCLLGVLRRKNVSLELAFNLHASQLASYELTEHIRYALMRHELPGSRLLFELSENGLLDLQPKTQENLLRLRMLGCGLSIDDFGVGFSSLKLLCQLPFNQIKLDGEFVRNLAEPRSRAMVSSTKALAHSLNMSLVIEGVSSQQIRDVLVQMDCKIGQGYYLARPMTGHCLLKWLEEPRRAQ